MAIHLLLGSGGGVLRLELLAASARGRSRTLAVRQPSKQDRSARIVVARHAFVQNLRRGRYELAVEEPVHRRLAVAFNELAVAIRSMAEVAASARHGSAQRNMAWRAFDWQGGIR